MANKNKAKGTRAETKLVNYLVEAGLDAKRQALHGNTDHGDVLVRLTDGDVCVEELIIEVKAGEQTLNYNRTTKEEWLRQTCAEVRNAKVKRGFLVIARHRRGIQDWEVWSADGHSFWFLNHFPNHLKNTVRKAKKNEEHQALPGYPRSASRRNGTCDHVGPRPFEDQSMQAVVRREWSQILRVHHLAENAVGDLGHGDA